MSAHLQKREESEKEETHVCVCSSQVVLVAKNPPAHAGDRDSIPGSGRSVQKETMAHSSNLPWRIPQIEEPGRLQSMGLQTVRQS